MPYRAKISLYVSLSMNLFYAAFKLFAGILYASFWYGADAIFFIVLSGMRLLLFLHVQKEKRDYSAEANDSGVLTKEYRQYRFCGFMLLALDVAFIGVITQIVSHSMGYQYPGHIIYAVAFFTFLFLSLAIKNMVIYRKLNSPVLSAIKAISFVKALVALFSLQNTMLITFGDGDVNSAAARNMMNALTGGCVCLLIFGMAMYMIIRANKKLRKGNK